MKSLINAYKLMLVGFAVMAFTVMSPMLMASKGLLIAAIVAKFVLVIAICFTKNESLSNMMFIVFAALCGLVLHPVIFMSGIPMTTVVLALGLTVALFAALTAYAIFSGRDFSAMGGFLFAALLLIIVCGIANIFIGSPIMELVLAWITLVVFCGFLLYDTQSIIESGHHNTTAMNALNLFLNILNIFMSLLRILKD